MKPKTILFVIESLRYGSAENRTIIQIQNLDYKTCQVHLRPIKIGG